MKPYRQQPSEKEKRNRAEIRKVQALALAIKNRVHVGHDCKEAVSKISELLQKEPLGYRAVVQVLGDLLQIKESKKVALRLLKETVRAGHLSQAARIVDELSKEEKTPRIVTIDTTGKLETIDPKSDHNVVKALRSLGGGL